MYGYFVLSVLLNTLKYLWKTLIKENKNEEEITNFVVVAGCHCDI